MPLVYDFKDIASRMKGELKESPHPRWRLCLLQPLHGETCYTE